jgi:hypothetical protein
MYQILEGAFSACLACRTSPSAAARESSELSSKLSAKSAAAIFISFDFDAASVKISLHQDPRFFFGGLYHICRFHFGIFDNFRPVHDDCPRLPDFFGQIQTDIVNNFPHLVGVNQASAARKRQTP